MLLERAATLAAKIPGQAAYPSISGSQFFLNRKALNNGMCDVFRMISRVLSEFAVS